MKIKRIYTMVAVITLDHRHTFECTKHKLDFHPELNMFKVDNVLIPVSNIREVLLEEEEGRVQVSSSHASLVVEEDARPTESITKSKTKVKK